MKNMPRSLCSGHVKKLQPTKVRFCVGGVFGRRAFSLFSFFSMSDCRAGFFVEALRNIVRSLKWSGRSPKKLRNGLGAAQNPRNPKKVGLGEAQISSEIVGGQPPKLRNGRVKPKKILKWSGKSPEAQKGSEIVRERLKRAQSGEAKKGLRIGLDWSEA